jgi:hypothetical protein
MLSGYISKILKNQFLKDHDYEKKKHRIAMHFNDPGGYNAWEQYAGTEQKTQHRHHLGG